MASKAGSPKYKKKKYLIFSQTIFIAAIPISILQGVFFALEGPWEVFNLFTMCLAVATLFFSFKYLKTHGFPVKHQKIYDSLVIWAIINFFCMQFSFFVINLISTEIPFNFRLLQVGITVSYLATAMVSLLAVVRILSLQKAFILSFSFAAVFFLIELTLNFLHSRLEKNQTTFAGPEWVGRKEMHTVVGSHYSPYSVLKTCYPDNPRGYFEEENMKDSKWRLFVNDGNEANLVFPSGDSEILRIDIKRAIKENSKDNLWAFILRMEQLPLKYYNGYEFTFKARADRPRNIRVLCIQSKEPWTWLGLNMNIELTSEWQSFNAKFAARADEDNAMIQFILNEGSDISVELSDISLYNESNKRLVEPELSLIKRFLVSYKFNALGCRGRDYTIPGKSDMVRIAILGNSFTLGTGVHEYDTFANQLERLLNDGVRPLNYEVINCGVSGYSTREERLFYELFASKYKPDIVLIVMVLDAELSSLEEAKKIDSYNPGNRDSLFYLWSCIQKYRNDSSLPNYSGSLREILQLYNKVQKQDANLAVVFFRNVPDDPASDKSAYYKSWMDFINKISIGIKDTNIPVLDLGKALFGNHSEQDLLVHKVVDGHPNEIAHGIVSREIMDFLEREGLIK